MAQSLNRGFRRRMHSATMGEIIRQLEYKCELHGRRLLKVGHWFASSKLCSTPGCNFLNKGLKLSTRVWTCPQCGVTHERDHNAAMSLRYEGVRLLGLTR